VKKFFAPEAQIDPKIGGRYQIIFLPSKDPEGESHGTKGARTLDLVPNQKLVFLVDHICRRRFAREKRAALCPPSELNLTPLPTWVELSFEPVADQPNQTHLKFAHYEFRDGEKWEQSYRWFRRAWKGVLDQLSEYCQKQKSNRISNGPRSMVDFNRV